MYLTRALKCAVNTTSEHEIQPTLVSFPAVLRRGLAATYALRQREKLGGYAAWVASTGDGTFAEISHMFIKSWADVALDWLLDDPRYDVHIVVLRRWLPLVVRSFLAVDVWREDSLLKYNGGEYTVHHDKFALLPAIRPYSEEDSVDLILGYLVDMELQQQLARVDGDGITLMHKRNVATRCGFGRHVAHHHPPSAT
jgi:hypothetical protein